MTAAFSLAGVYLAAAVAGGLVALQARAAATAGGRDVLGLAVCAAWWALTYALETLADAREMRLLWSQLSYVGIYGAVAFLMRFCVRWITPRAAGWWLELLWVVPLIMVFVAFTNEWHNLLWVDLRPSRLLPFVWRYEHGPLFWIGIAYQYLLIAACGLLVFIGVLRRSGVYRRQAQLVLIGMAVAVSGNLVYVSGALGEVPIDVTPLTFVVAAGLLFAGISRARLLELLPVARSEVVDLLPDGLLVLDDEMRIVDWNEAALRMWHIESREPYGVSAAEVIPGWSDLVPAEPAENARITFEEGAPGGVCHHIDMTLRRFPARRGLSETWVALFHDATELRATQIELEETNDQLEVLNRELTRRAVHDGLTGLFNRSYLDHALPREIARAQRDGRSVGILIVDIDHFKSINDRFGHEAGDDVLARVAVLVRGQLRATDVPCRFGGDELVGIMPGASHDDALLAAHRIREAFERLDVGHIDPSLTVTASIGVAVYPADAGSAAELSRAADLALYRAKDAGRNCVKGAGDA